MRAGLKIFILFAVPFLAFARPASAATIIFKSGEKVVGTIMERSDQYVEFETSGTTKLYFLEDIATIEEDAALVVEKKKEEPAMLKGPNPAGALAVNEKKAPEKQNSFSDQALMLYGNRRGDINIRHPQGWHIMEKKYAYPYQIYISRERIKSPNDVFEAGITIFKYYHQSWYLNLNKDNVEQSLLTMAQASEQAPPGVTKTLVKRKSILLDGASGIMDEAILKADSGREARVYHVFAMKDDVFVQFILEAKPAEFENYRGRFEEILKTARIFNLAGREPDNKTLDKEIEQYVLNDAVKSGSSDFRQVAEVFEKAVAMNPSNAKTRFLRAGFLMDVAKGADQKNQGLFLKEAEADFMMAAELYMKFPQDYDQRDRHVNLGQIYFLLGDMYYFPYGQKDNAKEFYKKSVEFGDPRASEALKKQF
ncbi:MAG: hypothetical protein WC676_05235 [Candidatus Omnitrophota bacterium]